MVKIDRDELEDTIKRLNQEITLAGDKKYSTVEVDVLKCCLYFLRTIYGTQERMEL